MGISPAVSRGKKEKVWAEANLLVLGRDFPGLTLRGEMKPRQRGVSSGAACSGLIRCEYPWPSI